MAASPPSMRSLTEDRRGGRRASLTTTATNGTRHHRPRKQQQQRSLSATPRRVGHRMVAAEDSSKRNLSSPPFLTSPREPTSPRPAAAHPSSAAARRRRSNRRRQKSQPPIQLSLFLEQSRPESPTTSESLSVVVEPDNEGREDKGAVSNATAESTVLANDKNDKDDCDLVPSRWSPTGEDSAAAIASSGSPPSPVARRTRTQQHCRSKSLGGRSTPRRRPRQGRTSGTAECKPSETTVRQSRRHESTIPPPPLVQGRSACPRFVMHRSKSGGSLQNYVPSKYRSH